MVVVFFSHVVTMNTPEVAARQESTSIQGLTEGVAAALVPLSDMVAVLMSSRGVAAALSDMVDVLMSSRGVAAALVPRGIDLTDFNVKNHISQG
jgi:hypothetical protein